MTRFAEAEEEIRKAEQELAEAEASGASSKRILDLGRKGRRLRRELWQARRFHEQAKREREIREGIRASLPEEIAAGRKLLKEKGGDK